MAVREKGNLKRVVTTTSKSPVGQAETLEAKDVQPTKLAFSTSDCQTPGRYLARHRSTRGFQVFLRIRPLLEVEDENSEGKKQKRGADAPTISCIQETGDNKVFLKAPEGSKAAANGLGGEYEFSKVLGPETSQRAVFEEVGQPFLDILFQGQNGLIFSYGVTNSGKTYTMLGTKESPGLLPRIISDLFQRLEQGSSEQRRFHVKLSYLEIYNDKIYDLLSTGDRLTQPLKPLSLKSNNDTVYVAGLREVTVPSKEQAAQLIAQGASNRSVCETQLNADSSRSHSVVNIKLVEVGNPQTVWSKLSVVDLAGAERTNRTRNTGARFQEAAKINTSLMVLGRCLEILSKNQTQKKQQVVPFRDSKITRLFQDALQGWGVTAMVANANPHPRDYDETLHALKYAAIAKEIKVQCRVDTGRRPSLLNPLTGLGSPEQGGLRTCHCAAALAARNESVRDDEYINQLLDQIFDLKGDLVNSELEKAQLELKLRADLCLEMEYQVQELEQAFKERLQKETEALERSHARKMQLYMLSKEEIEKEMEEEIERLKQENSALKTGQSLSRENQDEAAALLHKEEATIQGEQDVSLSNKAEGGKDKAEVLEKEAQDEQQTQHKEADATQRVGGRDDEKMQQKDEGEQKKNKLEQKGEQDQQVHSEEVEVAQETKTTQTAAAKRKRGRQGRKQQVVLAEEDTAALERPRKRRQQENQEERPGKEEASKEPEAAQDSTRAVLGELSSRTQRVTRTRAIRGQ